MRRVSAGLLAGALVCAVGAQVSAAAPETAIVSPSATSAQERELIERAQAAERELQQRGLVYPDAETQSYVSAVGTRLMEAGGVREPLRFLVMRDPLSNTFALPSGGVYITLGLLGRLHNEAQLAQVLGHEMAHIIAHHAERQRQSQRRKIIAAHLTDIALMGTAVAYLPFIASIAHYSRELEEEADRLAVDYLAAAGYNLDSAAGLFAVIEEIPPGESVLGSLYASHPDSARRAAYTRERAAVAARAKDGRVGEVEYRDTRLRALGESTRLKLGAGQYELALRSATVLAELEPEQPLGSYLIGEAQRHTAEQPELAAREQAVLRKTKYSDALVAEMRRQRETALAAAEAAYARALVLDPQYAPAHRGLGLVAHARGQSAQARESLERYLALAPTARDRRYVEYLLSKYPN